MEACPRLRPLVGYRLLLLGNFAVAHPRNGVRHKKVPLHAHSGHASLPPHRIRELCCGAPSARGVYPKKVNSGGAGAWGEEGALMA